MSDLVVVTFDQLTQARMAMSELQRLADEEAITIRTAAIVVREPDGRFWMPEGERHVGLTGTAAGGLLGALVGALTGPIGLLAWGAAGALVGSRDDARKAAASEETVSRVAQGVPPGTAALLADVDEEERGRLDAAMAASGGAVTRLLKADIEAELAAADDAAAGSGGEAASARSEEPKAP